MLALRQPPKAESACLSAEQRGWERVQDGGTAPSAPDSRFVSLILVFFFFFLLTCNKSSCLEARVSPFAFGSCYFSAQPRKVMCIRALWITDVQEIICGVMGYL